MYHFAHMGDIEEAHLKKKVLLKWRATNTDLIVEKTVFFILHHKRNDNSRAMGDKSRPLLQCF